MGLLIEEVKLWNTPLVGAFLLWSFTKGYSDNHQNGDSPVGLLHFIALAILTNKELMKPISNMRDDLQSYVRSFQDKNESDILLNIQPRTLERREQTLKAIDVAIAEGLLAWDTDSGKLYSRKLEKRPGRGKALKKDVKRDGVKAEILGKWFSQHDLPTIAAYLRVVF
ncbi:MAG: hypothetical protein KUG78_21515 [Kangiellaceae bacterium]|nr:hypothetical protein [Kangiellaceae bacterium]